MPKYDRPGQKRKELSKRELRKADRAREYSSLSPMPRTVNVTAPVGNRTLDQLKCTRANGESRTSDEDKQQIRLYAAAGLGVLVFLVLAILFFAS
eukprot:gene5402-5417_t